MGVIICRTCLSIIHENDYHKDLDYVLEAYEATVRNVLQVCIAEVDLSSTDHSVICNLCMTLLKTTYEFKIKCLTTEEKIFDYKKKYNLPTSHKVRLFEVLHNIPPSVFNLMPVEPEASCAAAANSSDVYYVSDDNNIKTIPTDYQLSASLTQAEYQLQAYTNQESSFYQVRDAIETVLNVPEADDIQMLPYYPTEQSYPYQELRTDRENNKGDVEQSLPYFYIEASRSNDVPASLPPNLLCQSTVNLSQKQMYDPVPIPPSQTIEDSADFQRSCCVDAGTINNNVDWNGNLAATTQCEIVDCTRKRNDNTSSAITISSSGSSQSNDNDLKSLDDACSSLNCSKSVDFDFRKLSSLSRYVCRECEKPFERKRRYAKHYFKHKGEYPYKCGACPFTTAYKSSLRRHELDHNAKHICPVCQLFFSGTYFLCVHLQQHRVLAPNFQNWIIRNLPVGNSLLEHYGNCQQCFNGFLGASFLEEHTKFHSTLENNDDGLSGDGLRLKIFSCTFCQYSTTISEKFKTHINWHII